MALLWKWNYCNTLYLYYPGAGCCASWLGAMYSSDLTHHKNVTTAVTVCGTEHVNLNKEGRRLLYSNETSVKLYKKISWIFQSWNLSWLLKLAFRYCGITDGQDLVVCLIYSCSRVAVLTLHWGVASAPTCSVSLSVQVFLQATPKNQPSKPCRGNRITGHRTGSQHTVLRC